MSRTIFVNGQLTTLILNSPIFGLISKRITRMKLREGISWLSISNSTENRRKTRTLLDWSLRQKWRRSWLKLTISLLHHTSSGPYGVSIMPSHLKLSSVIGWVSWVPINIWPKLIMTIFRNMERLDSRHTWITRNVWPAATTTMMRLFIPNQPMLSEPSLSHHITYSLHLHNEP